jgi:hypothetical protein
MFRYQPLVPEQFADGMRRFTKSECVELLWDLFCQSPWFDESAALSNVRGVLEKSAEIRQDYRRARREEAQRRAAISNS